RNPLVKDGGVFTSVNLNLTPYLLYTARQDEFAGIAIIIGDHALSTQSGTLVNAQDLHETPTRTATLKDVPLTINLYADAWTSDEILYALFFGL
ncbi:CSS-motif domain-containing protein, partial [Enterobacter hormaechei]